MEIRVQPSGARWAVRRAGRTKDMAVTDTQAEAIAIGRRYAQMAHCDFMVIGRDGMIRERDSFGAPYFPTRG